MPSTLKSLLVAKTLMRWPCSQPCLALSECQCVRGEPKMWFYTKLHSHKTAFTSKWPHDWEMQYEFHLMHFLEFDHCSCQHFYMQVTKHSYSICVCNNYLLLLRHTIAHSFECYYGWFIIYCPYNISSLFFQLHSYNSQPVLFDMTVLTPSHVAWNNTSLCKFFSTL